MHHACAHFFPCHKYWDGMADQKNPRKNRYTHSRVGHVSCRLGSANTLSWQEAECEYLVEERTGKMVMQEGNVQITTFISDAVALTLQLTRSVLLMHFLCPSVLVNYSSCRRNANIWRFPCFDSPACLIFLVQLNPLSSRTELLPSSPTLFLFSSLNFSDTLLKVYLYIYIHRKMNHSHLFLSTWLNVLTSWHRKAVC